MSAQMLVYPNTNVNDLVCSQEDIGENKHR
jgi:hypothetical protein